MRLCNRSMICSAYNMEGTINNLLGQIDNNNVVDIKLVAFSSSAYPEGVLISIIYRTT